MQKQLESAMLIRLRCMVGFYTVPRINLCVGGGGLEGVYVGRGGCAQSNL